MASDEQVFGIGSLESGGSPSAFNDAVRRKTRRSRAGEKAGPRFPEEDSGEGAEAQNGSSTVEGSGTPLAIKPEERETARSVLSSIGRDFAENRRKGKSSAWEQYQHDLSENLDVLVLGGAISLKEASQLMMAIEEFRKGTSDIGKTQSQLLGEWLCGGETVYMKDSV